MIEVWNHALAALRAGRRAVLMVVVDHRGSVPGTSGAKAVLSADGLAGTIGGGVVEKELCEHAADFDGRSELVHYDHTSDAVDSICMGIQEIALVGLQASDAATIEAIVSSLEKDACGTLRLTPPGIGFTAEHTTARSFESSGTGWQYVETLGKADTLFLVGGGHVALALSRLMSNLPFRIVVLDDRDFVPTMRDNHFASEKKVIEYDRVAEHVVDGEQSYAAIMTHAHQADAQVLRRLVGKELAYLGMMGSKAKVKQIFSDLEQEGINRELLDRVHAPIGVSIGSHSPAEIAVSIAAEIIAVRNRAGGA